MIRFAESAARNSARRRLARASSAPSVRSKADRTSRATRLQCDTSGRALATRTRGGVDRGDATGRLDDGLFVGSRGSGPDQPSRAIVDRVWTREEPGLAPMEVEPKMLEGARIEPGPGPPGEERALDVAATEEGESTPRGPAADGGRNPLRALRLDRPRRSDDVRDGAATALTITPAAEAPRIVQEPEERAARRAPVDPARGRGVRR
jgi:hypothetical protein